MLPVVQEYAARPANADEKLMTKLVCVLSSHLAVRHVKDEEIALGRKRNVACKLADREITAHIIIDEAELME
jgi:hypothetical protein